MRLHCAALDTVKLQGKLLQPQPAGTLHLEQSRWSGPPGQFQRWLWQVGVLQRAFPNSTLKLDNVVYTAQEVDIAQMLNCTELRDVAIRPKFTPSERNRQLWRALASLGRLHGGRLQLHVQEPDAFWMLEAEPSLAAHVSQADLRSWAGSADVSSSLADQVSNLRRLTHLTLLIQGSVLGQAGMLDALRQLSELQSLLCMGHIMQALLVTSVPCGWLLLTKLELSTHKLKPDPLD